MQSSRTSKIMMGSTFNIMWGDKVEDKFLDVVVSCTGDITISVKGTRMDAIEEEMKEAIGKTEMYDALAILSQFGINIVGYD